MTRYDGAGSSRDVSHYSDGGKQIQALTRIQKQARILLFMKQIMLSATSRISVFAECMSDLHRT
jgi:hypothetical protein